MENTNDNSIVLLRTIVDRQRGIIDEQNRRMAAYIAIIDFISTLSRSKDVTIPLDKITALLNCTTNDERDRLLVQYKMEIVQDVMDEFEQGVEDYKANSGTWVASPDNWSAPDWDDGVFAPPNEKREVDTDITKWKVFDRKWRMFGNG